MLEIVKTALRLRTDAFDAEVSELIEAAKRDLRVAGVLTPSMTDPLIMQAVVLYCKAHFGYGEAAESERFERAYDALKTKMSLAGDYRA